METRRTIMNLGRLIIVGLLSGYCLPNALWAQEHRIPVKIEGKRVLPLRVLARPMSNIYNEPDESKGIAQENVPTFQPYYVYTRPESKATDTDVKGWYEVGSNNRGNVLGWMRADDVLEWKQTMSLAYTHPEGRKPVLMFEDRDSALSLIKVSAQERTQKVSELYASIDKGDIPEDFPVRSVEPKRAVDITDQFYLLPIVEFGRIEVDGREGRILKLAAATAGGANAREKSSLKDNAEFRQQSNEDVSDIAAEVLKQLEIDLVFVMDMTNSMQSYIDKTLQVIKELTVKVTQEQAVKDDFHFGLWGYRDSETIPGIEFNTKNFTPSLQGVETFTETLSQVKAATVASEGYEEDVFGGVDQALQKTAWSKKALRFVVLIGDAPGHGTEHEWNASKQSADTLRKFADDNQVFLFALHIKDVDVRAEVYHATAQEQFSTLAKNQGVTTPSYASVASDDTQGFGEFTQRVADKLIDILAGAKQGKLITKSQKPEQAQEAAQADKQEASDIVQQAETMASEVGHAALVQWIGKATEAQAPRDIIAWAVDKDLMDPTIQSLDVRLLISKNQLDSLTKVLQEIMTAGRSGQIGGEDFFSSLQAAAAAAGRDASLVKNAQSMAATGMVPEFLLGLPYQSQLMAMNNDLWASWGTDEQDSFLNELQAKIELYIVIHDTPDKWIALNKQDDADEYVYPLSLDALP